MSGTASYAKRSDLTPDVLAYVLQTLERQAYRQLAAAQMYGFGLQFVPSLKWLKVMTWHVREETLHYEAVARMYKELAGHSVEPLVHARLAKKPLAFASSWLELAMAQFLYDRGGYWQLREFEVCAFLPYRELVARVLKEKTGHQGIGERIVVELCRTGKYDDVKQACFEKWLRFGMLTFGRPSTPASKFALQLGLKKNDAGAVMQDFVNGIKPAVKASGLHFPSMKAIGIDVPPWLDLDLTHVDATRAQGWNASPDSMP